MKTARVGSWTRTCATVVVALAVTSCGRVDFGERSPADAIPGLVVVYPMDDDPSGGVVVATVPELDGTCAVGAACPSSIAGVIGNAAMFDGSDLVVLPTSTLVGSAPYTVAVWVLIGPQLDRGEILVSKPDSAAQDDDIFNLLYWPSDGGMIYETTNGANAYEYLRGTGALSSAWHHAAATWDGTTKRLYVDGALASSIATRFVDSTLPIQLGADLDFGNPAYQLIGALDDLRFYDRPLTDDEIAILATPP